MGKIYKRRGSPYWYIRLHNRRYSTYTTLKTKAEDLLHRKEHELWQRRHSIEDKTNCQLQEFFNRYLEWLKTNRRAETLKSYRSIINEFNVFLRSYPSVRKVRDISPYLLEEFKTYRRRGHAKAWTVNNNIKGLKTIFNKALEWGYVYDNPAKTVGYIEITDAKPIRYLSEKEYKKFFEVCKQDFAEYHSIFYTFCHTGMRRGEILSLNWSDIDFKQSMIYIRSKDGFRPKGIDKKSKQAKTRVIPIHDHLKSMLYKLRQPSGKVFTYKGQPYSHNRLRRVLMRIARQAGIKDLTRLHELRHSYATFLVKHGVDIYKVKELLGHSDIRDTMRYAHMPTEFMKEDVKKLEALDGIDKKR
ncbi:MAG: site-specific integrase [Candidatus Omnitrophica bacterium]|nr:site-specific integrase [Candidatus Omnitrophota bacterium]